MIYTATGIKQMDTALKYLVGAEIVFYPEALLETCVEGDVVVISPRLSEEDITEVIRQLRRRDVRVILLYGKDVELAKKCITYQVYDLLGDPIRDKDVVERIRNPAKFSDVPEHLLPDTVDARPQEEPVEEKKFSIRMPLKLKLGERSKQELVGDPVEKPKKESGTATRILGKFIMRPGIISGGKFREGSWKSLKQMLDEEPDAIVISSSWDEQDVKDFYRDPKSRTTLLVAVGKKKIPCDFAVRKVTQDLIDQVTSVASKLKYMWDRAETDPLTGAYTRRFFEEWVEVQQKRNVSFSVALLDIDKFKAVNDTYGHDAGDAVLAAFAEFLKTNTRPTDLVCRYGGEEFLVCLMNTSVDEAYVFLDRIREKWSERETITSSARIKTTFSAGIAPGEGDFVKAADEMLYKAKQEGRNRIEISRTKKVFFLSRIHELQTSSLELGFVPASDPAEASVVIADVQTYRYAPENKILIVKGTGTVADFGVKHLRPDAKIVTSIEEFEKALNDIFGRKKPSLTVIPGKSSEKGQTLPKHAVVYVVCPSRPGLAGEVSARIASEIPNSALVCGAPDSTAALAIGIKPEELIDADWRIPGSTCPLERNNIKIWPVDPYKFLDVTDLPVNVLLERIKNHFSLVVVDCAGKLDLCAKASNTDGVIVIHREGDIADSITAHWVENYGRNVFVAAPGEFPSIIKAENGFVLTRRRKAAERSV